MGERLKELRKHLGLSRDDFAKRLGLKSRGKIENIELGRTKPDDAFIKLICNTFKVRYEWLVHGSGEMFQDDDSDAQAIIDAALDGKCPSARDILVKLAKMDTKYWEMLAEIIDQLKKE